MPHSTRHLLADLIGVAPDLLSDSTALQGLLIAGAGAAGLTPVGVPTARSHVEKEHSVVLFVAGGHIAAHTFPERQLLLLDVLCDARHEPRRVLEVFARRLPSRDVRSEVRTRS